MVKIAIVSLAFLLGAGMVPAQAQDGTFSALRVEPNPSIEGQPVRFVVHWSGCGYTGSLPTVHPNGAVVVVAATYSGVCGVPPPPVDVSVPIGPLAAGSYTLRFVGIDATFEPAIPDPPIDLPFVVTGGVEPVGAPTVGSTALAVLGALLALLAGTGLHARMRMPSRR
ncbi:MAG: hypothetical protein ABIR62_10700 [Dokdonella sp.]|uniref:hypothetical protein n=1 Tax=Dokdonella sp. TaxID=2291710 RepID=UPI0032670325